MASYLELNNIDSFCDLTNASQALKTNLQQRKAREAVKHLAKKSSLVSVNAFPLLA